MSRSKVFCFSISSRVPGYSCHHAKPSFCTDASELGTLQSEAMSSRRLLVASAVCAGHARLSLAGAAAVLSAHAEGGAAAAEVTSAMATAARLQVRLQARGRKKSTIDCLVFVRKFVCSGSLSHFSSPTLPKVSHRSLYPRSNSIRAAVVRALSPSMYKRTTRAKPTRAIMPLCMIAHPWQLTQRPAAASLRPTLSSLPYLRPLSPISSTSKAVARVAATSTPRQWCLS